MILKWFKSGISSKEDLKKEYRALAKTYHPDVNPDADESAMKEINEEYDRLYTLILKGIVVADSLIEDDSDESHTIVALPNAMVFLLTRNKSKHNSYKFFSKVNNYQLYHTSDDDPCIGIRPGFHVCEEIDHDDWYSEHIIRVVTDKRIEIPSMDEILQYILQVTTNTGWGESTSTLAYECSRPRKDGTVYESDKVIKVLDTQFGKIVTYMDIAVFMVNGCYVTCRFSHKYLHDYTVIQSYTLSDIICLNRFNMNTNDALGGIDLELNDIAAKLKFNLNDKLKDWPLDPLLTRYVRMGVLSVYRHGYQYSGHFNWHQLIQAIVDNRIDLEDIDDLQAQLDRWFNDCLKKLKTDIKRGRTTIV